MAQQTCLLHAFMNALIRFLTIQNMGVVKNMFLCQRKITNKMLYYWKNPEIWQPCFKNVATL